MVRPSVLSLAVAVAVGLLCVCEQSWAQGQESVSSPSPEASADVYVDNLLDPSSVKKFAEEDATAEVDPNGRPRQWNVEVLYGRSTYNDQSKDEAGIAVDGNFETDNFGVWSVNAVIGKSSGDLDRYQDRTGKWVSRQTIWQRQLYLPGDWRLDNGFGVVNTPTNPLMRNQYRFFFPSNAIEGVSVHATQRSGLQIQSSYGRAGTFTGARLAGFERNDGRVGTLSVYKPLNGGWSAGGSYLNTNGEVVDRQFVNPEVGYEPTSSTKAVYAAAQWRNTEHSWQGNVMASDGQDLSDLVNAPKVKAQGVWMDGERAKSTSPYVHNYGVFYFEPGLMWGALPVNSDAKGGYYRISKTQNRLSWNLGLDSIQSISDDGFDGTYATSYVRYQHSSVLGYGGALNVRNNMGDTAYSAQIFADRRNAWGQTRVQIDQTDSTSQDDKSWQVTLDQAWPSKTGTSFSTAASYGQWTIDGEQSDTWNVSASGSLALGSKTTLDGTARLYRSNGLSGYRGNDINLSLQHRLTPRLSAVFSMYQARGYVRSPFILDPLYQDEIYQRTNDRSMFLSLRYNYAAGTRRPVLGASGPNLVATGNIEGRVFLDENNDKIAGAQEQGAANITVVLDGVYVTQTDANGRYRFDRVAVGVHKIDVVSDGLPLPWGIADSEQKVNVEVRQTATWDVPASR